MAFVITDECLSCGSCAAQCPAEAIDMGELHYEIDQEKCLECGSCAAQCPAEAIVNEKDVLRELIWKTERFFSPFFHSYALR